MTIVYVAPIDDTTCHVSDAHSCAVGGRGPTAVFTCVIRNHARCVWRSAARGLAATTCSLRVP